MNRWSGKKVLVTGHTGFKGAWLSLLLTRLGARVSGFSRGEFRNASVYKAWGAGIFQEECFEDVGNIKVVEKFLEKVQPDVVFHLGAQALVGRAKANPAETFLSNTCGTFCLVTSLMNVSFDGVVVCITSDKSYFNRGVSVPYVEDDDFGGTEAYGLSKACAEIVISGLVSLEPMFSLGVGRAGNVFGGGDFSSNRLVPDIWRSIIERKELVIRNPNHTRPWLFVLDALNGYINLAGYLLRDSKTFDTFNFGPPNESLAESEVYSVRNLVDVALTCNSDLTVSSHVDDLGFTESPLLALSSEKAKAILGWAPEFGLQEGMKATLDMYECLHRELPLSSVEKYLDSYVR